MRKAEVLPRGRASVKAVAVFFLFAAAAAAQTLPDGPGKDTFESVCSVCHSPVAVIGQHKTKAEWKSKVNEMLQQQTDVAPADVDTIVDYLAKNFPPEKIDVNKADAGSMESALGVSAKDAAAIVGYRQANGNFKSIDDLKKVPGIDTAKIEADKLLIEFQ